MASMDHLFSKIVFLLVLATITTKCNGNDILGCGGFVKSHVPLDFSKIEIGLYTKAGSLKERTECAPTNGYYFLPLYEKGEYVLKVHPPPGWSFEPSEVNLVVDGTTDQCSTGQDINFSFNGFGITGRVITAGQTQGPSGIAVQLINDKGEKRDTVTAVGGDFHFTPVIPGKYTLKASHPKWKLDPGQAVVQVKEGNTALPVGVLAVKGYDVKGSVLSFGSPIGGIYVLLYSKEESPKFRVEGCKTALLQGVPDSPICHAITDASGEFTFGLVPAGEYRLMALSKPPGQGNIRYNIRNEIVPFTVKHDSLFIKNAFEVTGFTVIGSVLTHAGGAAVAGARVLLDGKPAGTADKAGKFTLPTLQPGTYTLSFQHEQCEFDDIQLQVSPTGPTAVPVAKAARWRVCGAVTPPDTRTVVISGGGSANVRVQPGNDGKWCTFLKPGVYSAQVDVTEAEQREGLQFYPLTQKISVGHAPVSDLSFSQLKAQVSGRIVCGSAACRGMTVTLRPLAADGGYTGTPRHTTANNGEYTFTDVLPGSVEVSVPTGRLCWTDSRHNVPVGSERATVPDFQLSGYGITVHSSHQIEVEYTSSSSRGTLSVPAGVSSHCVPSREVYTLTPRGPHRFQPDTATVQPDTEPMPAVHFVATAHAVLIKVLSPTAVKDLVLKVTSDSGSRDVGPLPALTQPQGGYSYEHTIYLADGEVSVISAWSSTLLFHPSGPQQVVGRSQPAPPTLTLRAVAALTLQGKLVPPVPDVLVTLASDDTKVTQTTGKDGAYRFGPLDASKHYTITAEKESYVFTEPDASGNIKAHKLAEITVQLVDDADDKPLQGALVSVSGGSYRRNAASTATGSLRFAALSPAQYYVKPNMKEYRFTPTHHIVDVKEGHTHTLTLRGVRVAWSCIGRCVSLGGAGWRGAVIAAVPTLASPGNCATEEATTEANGGFRIRGLLPKCVYTLQLKESNTPDLRGLKLAKAPATIEVKNNKDIEDVLLIAIQPQQITDANVLVYTPNIEHYKTLRLTLALENSPHTPIYSTKLDPAGYSQHLNPGLMYVLPRLPADNKTYILQLESSLSKSTHSYGEEVYYFNSDGKFKVFNIDFLPKVKSSEQELRQTSLLVVPLLAALVAAFFYREHLLAQVLALGPRLQQLQRQRGGVLDPASSDRVYNQLNTKRTSRKKAL